MPYNNDIENPIQKEIYLTHFDNKSVITEITRRKYPYKYRTISIRSVSLDLDKLDDMIIFDKFFNNCFDTYDRSFCEYDKYGIIKLAYGFKPISVKERLKNWYINDIIEYQGCFGYSGEDYIVILSASNNNFIENKTIYYNKSLNRIYKEESNDSCLYNYYDISKEHIYNIIRSNYVNIRNQKQSKVNIINIYDKNNLVLSLFDNQKIIKARLNKYSYTGYLTDKYNIMIDSINTFKNFDEFQENIDNDKNIIDHYQYSYE